MSDIRQYLVTMSDDGLTVRRVELTVPSGMRVQLTPGKYRQVLRGGQRLLHALLVYTLRLPVLYEGRSRDEAVGVIK